MLELFGARPRPVWEPGGCDLANGRGMESQRPRDRVLGSGLKDSHGTWFYCSGFLYCSVNPAHCNPFAEVRWGSLGMLRVLALQLNLTCHEKLKFEYIIPKSLAF